MIRSIPAFLFLLSSIAAAAPATIKVFEAPAHERPDASSPTVHTFVEGTEVSVSETPENGFRRVRLPDGNTAWIAESALGLKALASDAPVQLPALQEEKKPAATPTSKVFVKDLKHLAELVQTDPVIVPKARDLAQRADQSNAALYGGLGVGTAVALGGFFLLPQTDCRTIGSSRFCSYGAEHFTALAIGSAIMVAGLVAYTVIVPKRSDLLDVLNLWNQRHPEDPFEVTPRGAGLW